MAKPEIVIPAPMMSYVSERLAPHGILHQLWEADDPDKMIAAIAPKVRGMAAGLGMKYDAAFIDRFPALEIIAYFGVGYDAIDAAHAATRGIIVTNTPEVLTEEVADTAIGLMIMTVRELSAAERHLRAGKWTAEGNYRLSPGSLRDKSLGILGLGRIGKAVARRAEAFGLEITYHGRHEQKGVRYRYYDRLADMARDVDILMSVAPGGAETQGIVNAEVLKALGPDGFFVSIGRGTVVDEPALAAALRDGTICGAGLDVFAAEPEGAERFIEFENAVLLPHVGSASVHTRELMGGLVADNLISWFEDGTVLTPVAETPAPIRAKGKR